MSEVLLSERDMQALKAMARNGPLAGVISSPVPATCTPGQLHFDSGALPGEQLFVCVATDTWQAINTSVAVPTLQDVVSAGSSVTSADSLAHGVKIGTDLHYWILAYDSTSGLVLMPVCNGVINGCDHVTQLAVGYNQLVLNNAGTIINKIANDTGEMTHTTYDTEGTNNVFKYKTYKYFAFAGCQNATASAIWNLPTSNAPTAACKGTTHNKGVLEFADGATDLSAHIEWYLHEDWTGVIDAEIIWESASTSTNNVLWGIAIACAGAGDNSDPAYTDDDFTADANNGTANTYNVTASNVVTTTGTCAARDMMHIRVKRRLSQAGDTLAATARAVGLSLRVREAQ